MSDPNYCCECHDYNGRQMDCCSPRYQCDEHRNTLDRWEAEAKLLEPNHEYQDAEPSRSGKRGVRCMLCDHYTNGMERGSCSPCPNHASKRILILCKALRRAVSALKYAEEDQCDRYYTNVREEIESIFEEPALIAMAKEVEDEPESDFDFGERS